MDFSKLITGADNLFRFFSFAGLIIIGFAILFPNEKQKEIDFDIIEYKAQGEKSKKEIEHIKAKMVDLKRSVSETTNNVKKLAHEKDSLIKIGKKQNTAISIEVLDRKKEDLKSTLESEFEKLEELTFKTSLNEIEVESVKSKIIVAQMYLKMYTKYFWFFIVFGIILTLYGFVKWHGNQETSDEIQKTQLAIAKKELEKTES